MKKRVCRYLRRSRDDDKNETLEETLARQTRMTDAMAADRGLEVAETYQEVVSGASISERPEMRRLLNDIKDGRWDIVVVPDISRLSRGDGSDQSIIANAFRLTGTKCYSDWKVYDLDDQDDLELFERKLQNSRIEYKAITKRLHRGVMQSVSSGYLCGVAPYGLRVTGSRRKHVLEKDELFPNYLMAMEYCHDDPRPTWHGLQKLLHSRGIASPRGSEWWPKETLQYMVNNDAYLGYVVWGVNKTESYLGEDFSEQKRKVVSDDFIKVEAAWPPFIDREYAAEARSRINRKSPAPRSAEITNPLAGLLRCSKCGYVMARRLNSGNRHLYFVHADFRPDMRSICNCKAARAEALMEMLADTLEGMVEEQQVMLRDDGIAGRVEKLKEGVASMTADIERSRKSMMDAYYRLDRGIIDEAIYKGVQENENRRIARLEESIADAEREIATIDVDRVSGRIYSLNEMVAAIRDQSLTAAQVNAILKSFIDRIEYTNFAPPKTRQHDIRLDIFLKS